VGSFIHFSWKAVPVVEDGNAPDMGAGDELYHLGTAAMAMPVIFSLLRS
jgi:hypothetical protein